MNKGQKYTRAFSRIKESVGNSSAILEDLDTINELVRKEMPKKPIILGSGRMYHFKCPTCGKDSIYATKNPRCMYCGQALDWESYEEDK